MDKSFVRTLQKIILVVVLSSFLLTVIVPILMAMLWSVVDPETPWAYPDLFPQKLSFARWAQVWQFTAIKTALLNSYSIAPIVAVATLILVLPTAYALGRYEFPGKRLAEVVMLIPLTLPGSVIALSFVQLFHNLGIRTAFFGIVVGHTVTSLPSSLRIMRTAFSKIPQDRIDAARDLGARPWTVIRVAYAPSLIPAAFTSLLLVFVRSIDEFNLSYLLGSPNFITIPTILYSFLGYSFVRPSAAVVSLILMLPNIMVMVIVEKFLRTERRSSDKARKVSQKAEDDVQLVESERAAIV